MRDTISRRGLLKGAALAGTLALGGALAGCAPQGNRESQGGQQDSPEAVAQTPEKTIDPVATYDCDVVVMGAGMAGLAAAVQAAQLGLGVVVLERTGAVGGGGRGTEGVFGVGSDMQEAAHIHIEPVEVIRRELEYHNNRVDGARWLDMVHASGDNITWLEENGVLFSGVVDNYRNCEFESFHWFEHGRAAYDYSEQMRAAAEKDGAVFLLSTSGESLIKGDDGSIQGMYATKRNGDYIRINAKAVIIAGGGIANNDEFIARGGWQDVEQIERQFMGFNGDGLRMVLEAGGTDSLDRFSGLILPAVTHSLARGQGVQGKGRDGIVACVRAPQALWVNESGSRFCAENSGDVNWQGLIAPIVRHKRVFSIFDKAIFDEAYKSMPQPFMTAEENDAYLEQRIAENPDNDCFRADTIEELADKVCAVYDDMDKQTLIDTFNRYNENCKRGADLDFAKPENYLTAMTPPFYCMRMVPYIIMTFGGIHTNSHFECMDAGKRPIPGLYAVGADSAELWPNLYTLNVPGSANGNNVNSGRHAAVRAGDYIGSAALGTVGSSGDTSPSMFPLSWTTPESMKDGTYTATADGIFGDITASVVIKNGKIDQVSQENQYETDFVGGRTMNDILIPEIIRCGNLDIEVDTIGGATASCTALLNAVEDCCKQAAK